MVEEEKDIISIFPNPSQHAFTVQSSSIIRSIKIMSLAGQVLYTNEMIASNQLIINTSDIPSGISLAEIQSEHGVVIKKIIRH